ncbi:hypothetical protein EMCRGX_G000550, partial [Ephydatia muelleri]
NPAADKGRGGFQLIRRHPRDQQLTEHEKLVKYCKLTQSESISSAPSGKELFIFTDLSSNGGGNQDGRLHSIVGHDSFKLTCYLNHRLVPLKVQRHDPTSTP